jgi:hypothetical protein
MNTIALRHVRKLYNSPTAPVETNRHNQRAWVRSVRQLGDKWILAARVGRKDKAEELKP